jgi:glutamate racemase
MVGFFFLKLFTKYMTSAPIGIFDSGYGGLTVLKEIAKTLPQYDYIYLGDNARNPYGSRSFEVVYQFTLESVQKLFSMGCQLVILACNTASAKALRTIQQSDLPRIDPQRRVLGVIRPSAEIVGNYTVSRKVGVLGTSGTVISNSYPIEIKKLYPQIEVFQQACPLWVPLIENNEHLSPGADYFVDKYLQELLYQDADIDTIILGCTHYPLLQDKIKQALPKNISLISQGPIVAESLKDYLHRHPEMETRFSRSGSIKFYTTDSPSIFDQRASIFYGSKVASQHLSM